MFANFSSSCVTPCEKVLAATPCEKGTKPVDLKCYKFISLHASTVYNCYFLFMLEIGA
jgi:hypothetical protein